MPRPVPLVLAILLTMVVTVARAATPSGDAKQGTQLYGACAACHSLAPDRNMTGPSLAGIWGRKAGSLKSFERYSAALQASSVVWDEKTLDAWLKSPSRFIPNNHMTFAGMSNAGKRADLIAFLKEESGGQMPVTYQASGMGPDFKDLKKIGPDRQVQSIRICRQSYFVTTADGKTADFWEPNLRFQTDSSDLAPLKGTPAVIPAGMMGDRAAVIFAAPEEISAFIKRQC